MTIKFHCSACRTRNNLAMISKSEAHLSPDSTQLVDLSVVVTDAETKCIPMKNVPIKWRVAGDMYNGQYVRFFSSSKESLGVGLTATTLTDENGLCQIYVASSEPGIPQITYSIESTTDWMPATTPIFYNPELTHPSEPAPQIQNLSGILQVPEANESTPYGSVYAAKVITFPPFITSAPSAVVYILNDSRASSVTYFGAGQISPGWIPYWWLDTTPDQKNTLRYLISTGNTLESAPYAFEAVGSAYQQPDTTLNDSHASAPKFRGKTPDGVLDVTSLEDGVLKFSVELQEDVSNAVGDFIDVTLYLNAWTPEMEVNNARKPIMAKYALTKANITQKYFDISVPKGLLRGFCAKQDGDIRTFGMLYLAYVRNTVFRSDTYSSRFDFSDVH